MAEWFDIIRWIGAAYLVWLGISRLRAAWRAAGRCGRCSRRRGGRWFWQGAAVSLSNPKVLLFLGAFFPQFIDPTIAAGPQLALLAVTFVLVIDRDCADCIGCRSAGWFTAQLAPMASAASLIFGGLWLGRAPGCVGVWLADMRRFRISAHCETDIRPLMMPTRCMSRTVFYAGSFDPVTLGHLDLIARAARGCSTAWWSAIGVHHGKKPLFSADERIAMLRERSCVAPGSGTVDRYVTFDNLVVDAARKHGAVAILRGIRDATDFDYEMQMTGMNGALAPGLDTVFLPAAGPTGILPPLSSARSRRWAVTSRAFVPPAVAARLKEKLAPPGRPENDSSCWSFLR